MKTINALLIEDDPEDVLLLVHLMGQSSTSPFLFALECADDLKAGLEVLARGGVEVVLLDLMLPDSQGLETISKVRARFPEVPLVVLTGLRDEAMGLEAVACGAQDYQVKGSIDAHALKRTLSYAVERHRMLLELKRLERLKAEIKERQRMDKLKDELMSVVSHEMRGPLTIIRAATSNMQEGLTGALSIEQASMVEMQHRNIMRLQRIVDNILDLSRLESGKASISPKRLDSAALVKDTVRGYRIIKDGRPAVIEAEVPGGLPEVYADLELFIQVLSNLIDNARRFAKARILVRAQEAILAGRRCVQVSVIDDGPGIPKARIGELFSKFVQVNRSLQSEGYKGTGLGLAICKEIMERQQGTIWVDSVEGKGAGFHFALPQYDAAVHEGRAACHTTTSRGY